MYVSSSMVFERATEFPTTEGHIVDTADSTLGIRLLEARRRGLLPRRCTTSTACRTRSAVPSTPTGRARCPTDEPGIAHAVPDLIRKVLAGQRPLQIFGSGEQTRTLGVDDIADGIVSAMAHPAAVDEDFNVSARDELTVAEIARIVWEACGQPPDQFELEHLPSFDVDVQRRWPSVEKARTLLGWEAQIGVREGIAQTVEWLREQDTVGSRGGSAPPRRPGAARVRRAGPPGHDQPRRQPAGLDRLGGPGR